MLSGKPIVDVQKLVRKVAVANFVIDFIVQAGAGDAAEGPDRPGLRQAAGGLGRGAAGRAVPGRRPGKAFAAMDGRLSVAIDDVKKAAIPVLRHRVSTNFQAQAEGKTSEDIVVELLKIVSEPEPAKYVEKSRRS